MQEQILPQLQLWDNRQAFRQVLRNIPEYEAEADNKYHSQFQLSQVHHEPYHVCHPSHKWRTDCKYDGLRNQPLQEELPYPQHWKH